MHITDLAKLGEGGMGAVFRGRDTRLGRDVAIKILPDAFVLDADRLARFQREAQVLAALNHANVASIYRVEDRAIVLELVDEANSRVHSRKTRLCPFYTNLSMPLSTHMTRVFCIVTSSRQTSRSHEAAD